MINGQIWKRLSHKVYTGKACPQYVYVYVGSVHPIVQISNRNLCSHTCTAFHQYESFGVPLNGLILYRSWYIQLVDMCVSLVFVLTMFVFFLASVFLFHQLTALMKPLNFLEDL